MTSTRLTLSAVIPTKNRSADLGAAVTSILSQTRPPEELFVIDQSDGDESETLVRSLFGVGASTRLIYIHDPQVAGLVAAKHLATTRATGDIVCFLEDDVVLEPDYLARIEWGFHVQPDMCGCSGIITNWPISSALYVAARSFFYRGIFHDPRVKMYTGDLARATQLIPCDVLSGGLSAWKREVFAQVQFDTRNGFFMFEDMEFSTRVVRKLGRHLYVNPRARLEHRWSEVNRDVHGIRQRRKLTEAVLFYKKRREWPGAWHGLLLAMTWWLGDALVQGIRNRSIAPPRGYVQGVVDGFRKPVQP